MLTVRFTVSFCSFGMFKLILLWNVHGRMKCDINFSIVTVFARISLSKKAEKIKMTLGKIDINLTFII